VAITRWMVAVIYSLDEAAAASEAPVMKRRPRNIAMLQLTFNVALHSESTSF